MKRALVASVAVLAVLAAAQPASAKWYGSTLSGKPNASYGCETALTMGPLGGAQLSPTGQRSCTYQHVGYLNNLRRPGSVVPGNGRIRRIRIKSGPRPARLRLTVLTGSSRVDTFSGRDIPGTYTCCTARYISRPFRVRANAVTTKRTNVRVYDVRDKRIQYRIHSTDLVALTASGPGTVPLKIGPAVGGFANGTPLLRGFWPATAKGDPRVEGYQLGGIDLMFQWDWRRR